MTEVEIIGNTLVVRIKGLHKIWAFSSGLDVPLRHVVRAALYSDVDLGPGLIRIFGTGIPGVISAGIHLRRGEWEFWDVMNKDKAIVVEPADEQYSRLVIEVADPDSAVGLIRRVVV
jgi:hypothetical protein